MKSDKNTLILYHGSPDKEIRPTYGLGNDKHEYGKGFIKIGKSWNSVLLKDRKSVSVPERGQYSIAGN